jgi:hypothetical protein
MVHYKADDSGIYLDAYEDDCADFDDGDYALFVCHDANLKRFTAPSA